MTLIFVAGTHGWKPEAPGSNWSDEGSEFTAFVRSHGVRPAFGNGRPYVWSTDIGGIGFGNGDLRLWHASGINLYAYVVPPLCLAWRVGKVVLVVHSHGLQPALFAAAEGLPVDTLISVGSPIRKDMEPIAAQARPNIRQWVHVHSDGSDRWQWYGTLFDGRRGIVREAPLADTNIRIPRVGHTGILETPAHFPEWLKPRPELDGRTLLSLMA